MCVIMSQNGEIIVGSSGTFESKLPDEGSHLVYCYGIVVIGTVPGYQDAYQEKVMFLYETPQAKAVFNEELGEQPYGFSKEFTRSLHKQANLRKWVDAWRGKPLTEEEATAFNIVGLMDIPIVAQIYHKEGKNSNKKYVEVSSIAPFRQQGVQLPSRGNQKIIFTWNGAFDANTFLKLPLWIRNKMIKSTEFVNLGIAIPMLQEEVWDKTIGKVVRKPRVQDQATPQSQNQMADNAFNTPPPTPNHQAPVPSGFNIPGSKNQGSESSGFKIP